MAMVETVTGPIGAIEAKKLVAAAPTSANDPSGTRLASAGRTKN